MKHPTLTRYIEFIIGIFLLAISFNLFLLPNNILVGSISSLAIIVKHLCGIHPTFFILISTNVLLIINLILAKKITLKSVIGIFLFSGLISVTSSIHSYFTIDSNLLLSTICGGILIGTGYALIFKDKSNITSFLKINPKQVILSTNIFIIITGTFIFGITNVMYSLIALYIMNITIDKLLLKTSSFKLVHIISTDSKKIEKQIVANRLFKIKENKEEMLICLIPTKEYFKLKEEIHTLDPNATLITTDIYEVHNGS